MRFFYIDLCNLVWSTIVFSKTCYVWKHPIESPRTALTVYSTSALELTCFWFLLTCTLILTVQVVRQPLDHYWYLLLRGMSYLCSQLVSVLCGPFCCVLGRSLCAWSLCRKYHTCTGGQQSVRTDDLGSDTSAQTVYHTRYTDI